MSVLREAEKSVQAVGAFHTWHSGRTFHPGDPQIDPWMRDVLVSLQGTLNTMAQTQKAIAEQVHRNTRMLEQVVAHLNR